MKSKSIHLDFRTFSKVFILVLIFCYYGCNDDDNFNLSTKQNVDAEQTSSKNSGETINISTDAFRYLFTIASGNPVSSVNCPVITLDSTQSIGGKIYTITVNYGLTPCRSSTDSIRRSGTYIISGFINDVRDSVYGSLVFPSNSPYRIYKVSAGSDTNYITVSGDNTVYGRMVVSSDTVYSGIFQINNVFTTNILTTKSYELNITVAAELNNFFIVSDDIYTLRGSGSVTDNKYNLQFNFAIQDSLTKFGYYRYPIKGIMSWVRLGSSLATTYVNFYPDGGDPDDIVMIQRGSFTKTVNLELVDQ